VTVTPTCDPTSGTVVTGDSRIVSSEAHFQGPR